MVNYNDLPDTEINRKVFRTLGMIVEHVNSDGNYVYADPNEQTYGYSSFEPCNSWADAGPIIERNLISLAPDILFDEDRAVNEFLGTWEAQSELYPQILWTDKNPLRAAMICFLKLKDAQAQAERIEAKEFAKHE